MKLVLSLIFVQDTCLRDGIVDTDDELRPFMLPYPQFFHGTCRACVMLLGWYLSSEIEFRALRLDFVFQPGADRFSIFVRHMSSLCGAPGVVLFFGT